MQVILGSQPVNYMQGELEHHDALRDVQYSAVAEHAIQTGHAQHINWNNVTILAADSKEINLFYSVS